MSNMFCFQCEQTIGGTGCKGNKQSVVQAVKVALELAEKKQIQQICKII
ncbi:MAG: hypothetical protein H6Q70_3531 [Firmicutes bacterium]|nr:hypothetical protein [Bacillota bacterium]